jgi:uncharacterized phage-associated protein
VGEIEKGKRDVTLGELHDLADYLQVDVSELIEQDFTVRPKLEKYEEMLMQVIVSYKGATGKDIPKTFLAKLVYLADFAWFYEHLEPMSGMRYVRRAHGPVANEYFTALGTLIDDGKVNSKRGTRANWYEPVDNGDNPFAPQYLSVKEVALINKIVDKWKDASTAQIVDFTHEQLPWQICAPNEYIPYELITQEEPENVF